MIDLSIKFPFWKKKKNKIKNWESSLRLDFARSSKARFIFPVNGNAKQIFASQAVFAANVSNLSRQNSYCICKHMKYETGLTLWTRN